MNHSNSFEEQGLSASLEASPKPPVAMYLTLSLMFLSVCFEAWLIIIFLAAVYTHTLILYGGGMLIVVLFVCACLFAILALIATLRGGRSSGEH